MAGGLGTRMRSRKPKVLHDLCGAPMLAWVVAAALEAGSGDVVVVVSPGIAEQVSAAMVQIRTAAEQLAAEGRQRAAASETVNGLIGDLEEGLEELNRLAAEGAAEA